MLAAAICVPLVRSLLRRSKIYATPERAGLDDDAAARSKMWDLAARLIYIAFAGLLEYAVWWVLCAIETARISLLESAEFVLTPIRPFFAIPALFSGLLLAAVPIRLLFTGLLGQAGYKQLWAMRIVARASTPRACFGTWSTLPFPSSP
jgi:hypothetical protein